MQNTISHGFLNREVAEKEAKAYRARRYRFDTPFYKSIQGGKIVVRRGNDAKTFCGKMRTYKIIHITK
jgi:hypothetical protein